MRALYPSVPRDEASIAIEEALENWERKRIPTKDVLRIMDIVLNSNLFTFNDKTNVQKIGTAFRSKLGMTYACTYTETKSLATQNLVDILFIIKIPVLKID